MEALWSNPRYGASFEGFALEQTLILLGEEDAYYWKSQGGAELDTNPYRYNLAGDPIGRALANRPPGATVGPRMRLWRRGDILATTVRSGEPRS